MKTTKDYTLLEVLFIFIITLGSGLCIGLAIPSKQVTQEPINTVYSDTNFYDGEGNVIPLEAVRLLVQSQFVIMDSKEDSVLNRYFYFRNIQK